MKLRVLQPEGRRLVTAELAAGTVDKWPEAAWLPLVSDAPRAHPLSPLDEAIDELMLVLERFTTAIDPWFAPRLHRALPLTRREASVPGVWRYLAVIHRPDFVRYRWDNRSWSAMRSRFWSIGTRHTSNTFARLWWIAELTRAGDDYGLTERALSRQGLATQLFVRTWSAYRPAVEACVDALADAPGDVVERVVRELSRHLGTVPLEALGASDVRRVIARSLRGKG